jgi:hypothetical protein
MPRKSNKTRRERVTKLLTGIEEKLDVANLKATLADFLRLTQLERELEQEEQPKENRHVEASGGTLRLVIDYDPLPSQRRFNASEARFKGFSGPIGSGKSQALCQEAIRLSYLNPGRQGLVGAPTYSLPLSRGLRRSFRLS